ncbi:MAG: anti-sigma factor antagonist [Gemmatimonadales bacterium]|jgi:anti-anti-sigma factor
METVVENHGDVTVIRVRGSIDGLTAPTLEEVLSAHLGGTRSQLVGCLEDVDYTSSAGLRALLAAMKQARTHGGDLRLTAPQPAVLKVLELSGFAGILKIFSSVDDAVRSFAS